VNVIEGSFDASELRVAVVASRFNAAIVERLTEGALDCLRRHGAAEDAIFQAWVPGAFELPLVAAALAEADDIDAVICLGAVIRGATDHYVYVCAEAAKGIATVARETRKPVMFGVLTTDTIEQALERAGTKHGNKGWDVALAAIETANLLRLLEKREGSSF